MPADFDPINNALQQLQVDSYRGLVFATFSDRAPLLYDYLGPRMRPGLDRVFHKPIVYLGCSRQYSKSNWKLYQENVRDNYHASLLHAFFSTFNLYRSTTTRTEVVGNQNGLHNCSLFFPVQDASDGAAYKQSGVTSFKEGLRLEDTSILANAREFDDGANQIQAIFPQLVVQQIQNSLVARQILPKGPTNFELIFHFFGYADDAPEMRTHRLKQANLVGPAGLVSMEDMLATELVQFGTIDSSEAPSVADMCRKVPDDPQIAPSISESYIRHF